MEKSIKYLEEKIQNGEQIIQSLKNKIKILKSCKLQIGKPVISKKYGVALLHSIDASVREDLKCIILVAGNYSERVERTTELEDLLPYNEETRLLYE